ncbi:unnamed protein product [Amoebophrya sp. A25]|nr:unnamed protein product [Amoebophrya sp. A25]|eukprot:GSA25T00021278001.1
MARPLLFSQFWTFIQVLEQCQGLSLSQLQQQRIKANVPDIIPRVVSWNAHGGQDAGTFTLPENVYLLVPHERGLDAHYCLSTSANMELMLASTGGVFFKNRGWKLYKPGDKVPNQSYSPFAQDEQSANSCPSIRDFHPSWASAPMAKCLAGSNPSWCPVLASYQSATIEGRSVFAPLTYPFEKEGASFQEKLKICSRTSLQDIATNVKSRMKSDLHEVFLNANKPGLGFYADRMQDNLSRGRPVILIPFTCNSRDPNASRGNAVPADDVVEFVGQAQNKILAQNAGGNALSKVVSEQAPNMPGLDIDSKTATATASKSDECCGSCGGDADNSIGNSLPKNTRLLTPVMQDLLFRNVDDQAQLGQKNGDTAAKIAFALGKIFAKRGLTSASTDKASYNIKTVPAGNHKVTFQSEMQMILFQGLMTQEKVTIPQDSYNKIKTALDRTTDTTLPSQWRAQKQGSKEKFAFALFHAFRIMKANDPYVVANLDMLELNGDDGFKVPLTEEQLLIVNHLAGHGSSLKLRPPPASR